MQQYIKPLYLPLEKIDRKGLFAVLMLEWLILILLWQYNSKEIIPKPTEIFNQFITVIPTETFLENLTVSLILTLKAILYSTIISLLLSYGYVLNILKPITKLIIQFRYLPLTGIVFIFQVITPSGGDLKVLLLMFGIVPFFVTSMVQIVADPENNQYYELGKTLRMNRWQNVYRTIIKGKLSSVFDVVKQNFAICWLMITMVEGLSMSEGGIGAFIVKNSRTTDIAIIFAYQTTLLLIGIFFDWALSAIKNALFGHIRAANQKK